MATIGDRYSERPRTFTKEMFTKIVNEYSYYNQFYLNHPQFFDCTFLESNTVPTRYYLVYSSKEMRDSMHKAISNFKIPYSHLGRSVSSKSYTHHFRKSESSLIEVQKYFWDEIKTIQSQALKRLNILGTHLISDLSKVVLQYL